MVHQRRSRKKTPRNAIIARRFFAVSVVVSALVTIVLACLHIFSGSTAQSANGQAMPPQAQALAPSSAAFGNPRPLEPITGAAQMPFPLQQQLSDLSSLLCERIKQPNLHTGIFIVEPGTGRYVDIDSHRAYSAASMIKLPVLVSMLKALDGGRLRLDQNMCVRPDLKGGGSGWLQWRPDNTNISLNDCAILMMTISDNTATNMVIDLLGGKDRCNADFAEWGLTHTRINNWLPDLAGTNTTSPYDLALLLAKVDNGQLLSAKSRAWLFQTLEKNRIRTLLPMGLPRGARIADKTGDIGTLVGDAGVITAADGKRYIAAVAVERPWNDRRANALIRQISKDAYAGITGDTEGIKALEAEQSAAAKAPIHRRRRSAHHGARKAVRHAH